MRMQRILIPATLFFTLFATSQPAAPQATPASIAGRWRVVKIIPTHNDQCWDDARARTMLGSTLTYQPHAMVWAGGSVDISEALSRTQTRQSFLEEYKVSFDELGIKAASVTEIDLQHDDADVTGATTEVPGDTILLAGPGRIVVSACRVYYEAIRVAKPEARPAPSR